MFRAIWLGSPTLTWLPPSDKRAPSLKSRTCQISATKTKPNFKLNTKLQLLQNGHLIANNLIYPSGDWQACAHVIQPPQPACWWVDSWQLRDVYQHDSAIVGALDHTTHSRIALLVHGLNPTSDTNVAGGRAAGERLVSAWSRRHGPQHRAIAQALTSCQGLSNPLVSLCQHSRWWSLVAIFSYMAGIVGNP